MSRFSSCLTALLAVFFLSSCSPELPPTKQQAAPLSGHLLITGSSTIQPLLEQIAARFRTQHPAVTITVQGGGSGRGVADVRAHRSDIGMASHAVDDPKKKLRMHALARDGVALIVHGSNSVASLSAAQVVAMFTGKVRDWREVGGPPGAIRVLSCGQGRGSMGVFLGHYKIAPEQLRASAEIGENADLIADVLAHPLAIGFISAGEAARLVQAGTAIRLLPVDGITPSSHSIKSGDYPLTRPLTLVTDGSPHALSQQFIEFAQSPEVSDLILKYNFVPYRD